MSLPTYPGTNFAPVIEAYTKSNTVILPALVYMDFLSSPEALWGGHYDFTTGGVTWKGLGTSGLITSIEGIEASSTMTASDMTFGMSGVDANTMSVFSGTDREEYVGRLIGVYGQFCTPDWQPVPGCPPFSYAVGIMGTAGVSRVLAQSGGWTRSISLPAANIFYGRSAAKNSYFTDRDQQLRHPGDEFFAFLKDTQEESIPQPWR